MLTVKTLDQWVKRSPDGVVLLEGRRDIPAEAALKATQVSALLALSYPHLRFRSGNAEGADAAFSGGVAQVDSQRLQIITPYPGHRKSAQYPGATYVSPEDLSDEQKRMMMELTVTATPRNAGLVKQADKSGRAGAKAAYLIRDTIKVAGFSDEFPKPICALFYVNPTDPMAGGTGHTVRVCEKAGIPTVFQDAWAHWV